MNVSMLKEMKLQREKIKKALLDAKENSKKTAEDEIAEKFIKLQLQVIKLLDALHKIGCEKSHDWLVLIIQACDMMEPLARAQPFMVSSDEFNLRITDLNNRQTRLMEISRTMARKLLSEGKHAEAIDAAVVSLRFSIDVYGLDSVSLVPSYLILSEACIGIGNLRQADEYLSHAEWTILKSDDNSNEIVCKLFRKIGILHAAKGDYENAERMFAEDIYHGSLEWGTSDINTSGGYFHLANVFFRLNKMDIAQSLYGQVTDNYFNYLVNAVNMKIKSEQEASYLDKLKTNKLSQFHLDENLQAEALQIMHAIYEIREQSTKTDHEQFTTICYNLCLFYYLVGDIEKSNYYQSRAKEEALKVVGEGYKRSLPPIFDFQTNNIQEISGQTV